MITAKTRWSMVSVLATLALVLSGCASDASSESTGTKDSATPEPSVTQETATPSEATPTETATEPENPGLSQEELDEQLRDAAWANDIEAAEQLISWGADVNAKDSTVQSAYLITTSEGYSELLELTLENGADVTALDSWNGTGLIRAAERGHWEVVGILLQNGIDVDHVNRIGYQAIHEAVIFGRDDPTYYLTLQVLVAGGSSLTTPSVSQGMTPLQLARREGFSGQIAVLEALEGPARKTRRRRYLKRPQAVMRTRWPSHCAPEPKLTLKATMAAAPAKSLRTPAIARPPRLFACSEGRHEHC